MAHIASKSPKASSSFFSGRLSAPLITFAGGSRVWDTEKWLSSKKRLFASEKLQSHIKNQNKIQFFNKCFVLIFCASCFSYSFRIYTWLRVYIYFSAKGNGQEAHFCACCFFLSLSALHVGAAAAVVCVPTLGIRVSNTQ